VTQPSSVPRLVVDTNLILRAITGQGLPRVLYDCFLRGEVRFVVSEALMFELRRVLTYKRVTGLGSGISPSAGFGLALELMLLSEYHPTVRRHSWPSLSDPKDWFLLDLLWVSSADALLTLDGRVLEAGMKLNLPVLTLEQGYEKKLF
jgi:putative PIN family toxin of toxin-antitoxin system